MILGKTEEQEDQDIFKDYRVGQIVRILDTRELSFWLEKAIGGRFVERSKHSEMWCYIDVWNSNRSTYERQSISYDYIEPAH